MSKDSDTDLKHKTDLENNFLTHIGYEYTQQICAELDREEEQWKDIEVPESLDQWFADFIKLEQKRKRRKERKLRVIRYSRRAAVILLCLIGINYILVKNVDAYRVRWMNTITRIQQKFTQIDFVDDTTGMEGYIPKDWAGKYYLTYLPEDYQLSNTRNQGAVATVIYTNQEGEQIVFNQFGQNSSLRVDSESGEITKLNINGDNEAYCLQKGDSIMVSWKQEDIAFQINAFNITQNNMVMMAESIELQK